MGCYRQVPAAVHKPPHPGWSGAGERHGALRVIRPKSKEYGNMDTQHHDPVPHIKDLESKAKELNSLMLSLCEERIGVATK